MPWMAAALIALAFLFLPEGSAAADARTPGVCGHLLQEEAPACERRLRENEELCRSPGPEAARHCAGVRQALQECLPHPPAARAECLRAALRLPLLQARELFPACGLLLPLQQEECLARLRTACTGIVHPPRRLECLRAWTDSLNACGARRPDVRADCVRDIVDLPPRNPLASFCESLQPRERASCSNLLLDWQESCQIETVPEQRASCLDALRARLRPCGEAPDKPACVRAVLHRAPTSALFGACQLLPLPERPRCEWYLDAQRGHCLGRADPSERRPCLRDLFSRTFQCYEKPVPEGAGCLRELVNTEPR